MAEQSLLYANEEYKLVKDGNNIFFPEDVTYISDAIITFNVNNETLLVSGTPVSEQAISQIAFVAGSFNNNLAGDPYAMLTLGSRHPDLLRPRGHGTHQRR